MGTTLLDRLNVPVALLAFGLRRLPIPFPPEELLLEHGTVYMKKTVTGVNSR